MNTTIPQPIKAVLDKIDEKNNSSVKLSGKSMQDYQKTISEYKGVAIVSLIDIVAFDDINILYGYEIGIRLVDEIQSIIINTLKKMVTNNVFTKHNIGVFDYEVFHVHADKLCLFIKNDFTHHLLDIIVKQLSAKISKHKFTISDNNYIHLNVTFGATKADASVSLSYAEKALQVANKYHNSYIFHDSYSSSKHEHMVYEILLDNIKQETVTPYFQGIFDVNHSTVPYKFESLMRLMDSEGRVLSPVVFMDKSKEYRLYTQLMSQMIEKVFDVMDNNDVAITLNLSYLDINNIELCNVLKRKVKQMENQSRLTVEIVESEQIEDLEMVNEFIFSLKKLGVLIAIDDFGSGYSNFDNIVKLDVDYVKLDGSLISKIHDEKYRVILESMVNICRGLGIKTIAEYISDESILKLAKSIGVDYLQGYHLHKPEDWNSVKKSFSLN